MDVRSADAARAARQVEQPRIPIQEVVSGRKALEKAAERENLQTAREHKPRPAEAGKGQVVDVVG